LSSVHAPARRSFPGIVVVALLLIFALLLPTWVSANPHSDHSRGKGKVAGVMTRNLYLGADLAPAIGAENLPQLVEANGIIFRQVLGNDFPTRAKGLADEILATKPDLVGLQEVALWQTTPITPAGTAITLDYLELLLNELNEGNGKGGKGKPQYRVVEVQEEFGTEAPANVNNVPGDGPPIPGLENAEVTGKLTMRDVILARQGAGVQTWNEAGDNFDHNLVLGIAGQPVVVKRGWVATDAKVRGSHPFRFVNTHLEAFHPIVRLEQAEELVDADGPANSSLPVVLVGDLNSDDDTVVPPDTFAYNFLIGKGFVNRSTNNPLSCCIDVPNLAVGAGGDVSDFDHQVDHVLTRNPDQVELVSSSVTGREPVNGFWDSDHAGVFSALRFSP
jgi:endonuclease/exonuclease/phosphatase family metal-dependent hydrolase